MWAVTAVFYIMYELYLSIKRNVLSQIGEFGFAPGTEWLTAALAFAIFFIILRALRWLILIILRKLQAQNLTLVMANMSADSDKDSGSEVVSSNGMGSVLNQNDDEPSDIFGVLADFVEGLNYFFDFVIALYIATLFIALSEVVEKTINSIFLVIMVIYLVFALRKLIVELFQVFSQFGKQETEIDRTAVTLFRIVIEVFLWVTAAIIIMKSWGYDVSVLLGGLGVGAVIVSLSFQNVLKDVFSFFSIYADRTFKVGDFIKTDEIKGVVREINLRTTKLKAVGGHEVVVSNRKLVDGIVENFGVLEERQVIAEIIVALDTPVTKLEKIAQLITDYFNSDPALREFVLFRRAYLMQISSLGFCYEVVYVVTVADYEIYTQMKQKINLGIVSKLEKAGIKLSGLNKMMIADV